MLRVEKNLGEQVRHFRKLRGWSQADLAERMTRYGFTMHQTTVAKMESAGRPTRLQEVAALAAILEVQVTDLLVSVERPSGDDELAEATREATLARTRAERTARELHLAEVELGGATHKLNRARDADKSARDELERAERREQLARENDMTDKLFPPGHPGRPEELEENNG